MNEYQRQFERVRWDDLADFLVIARCGGLAAAARETGSSAPTLGRRMHVLERTMGRELFVRRTHGYDLTSAGIELMRQIETVSAQIDIATRRSSDDDLPLVKLSAGSWTSLALAWRWRELTGDPPDVRLRFLSSEAVLSISRREAAIAIRNSRPTETALASRKLAKNDFAIYAIKGAPDHWIVHTVQTPSSRWTRERADSRFCHEVSHPRLVLDLALEGAGQVVLPTFIGDTQEKLERRSDAIPELSHDAWLVCA